MDYSDLTQADHDFEIKRQIERLRRASLNADSEFESNLNKIFLSYVDSAPEPEDPRVVDFVPIHVAGGTKPPSHSKQPANLAEISERIFVNLKDKKAQNVESFELEESKEQKHESQSPKKDSGSIILGPSNERRGLKQRKGRPLPPSRTPKLGALGRKQKKRKTKRKENRLQK